MQLFAKGKRKTACALAAVAALGTIALATSAYQPAFAEDVPTEQQREQNTQQNEDSSNTDKSQKKQKKSGKHGKRTKCGSQNISADPNGGEMTENTENSENANTSDKAKQRKGKGLKKKSENTFCSE